MSGVFLTDCDCGLLPSKVVGPKIDKHTTDSAAVADGYRRWIKRLQVAGADDDIDEYRYWRIHGPSGHLIAIKNTPYGSFPPQPPPI